jgi:hypothetical protein
MVLETKVAERRLARIDSQMNGPAPTAISAVRTASRNVSFLSERRCPVTACTGADPDLYAVEKHLIDCRMGCRSNRPTGEPAAKVEWRSPL